MPQIPVSLPPAGVTGDGWAEKGSAQRHGCQGLNSRLPPPSSIPVVRERIGGPK